MSITKYTLRTQSPSTWRDLATLRDGDSASHRFARLFDGAQAPSRAEAGSWAPAMSVEETTDALILTAELPGLTDAEVSIELENNVLTISGEKAEKRTEGEEERRYHVWERQYGSFKRGFTLPPTVKGDDITARFEQGVLNITLPKVPEAKGRKIEIATA